MKTIFNFFILFWLFVLFIPLKSEAVTNLTICGTGDSQEILRLLGNSFEAVNPLVNIEIPDSVGSSGGIRAVLKGNCDLARLARPLNKNEKGHDLTYHLFALSPVVFVLHPGMMLPENVSEEQIVRIYNGEISNWEQVGGDNKKIYLVSREPQDSSRSILDEKIPGFKEIQNTPGRIFFTTQETVKAMASYRQTIGYMPLITAIRNNLKILSFNGITPTIINVQDGKYDLVTSFALAWKGELTRIAKDFVAFLHSSAAQEIMAGQGVFTSAVPLKTEFHKNTK